MMYMYRPFLYMMGDDFNGHLICLLFENVDATTIMDFIKEVNFYHLV